jgi:hypothetical protein
LAEALVAGASHKGLHGDWQIFSMKILTNYLSLSFTAVREDRTPGGKHKHKRIRLDDGTLVPCFILDPVQDSIDEKLLNELIELKPDLIPEVEGK